MSNPVEKIRDRWHRRALVLVRALVPGGDLEVSIPESSRAIDLVTDVGEAWDAWGVLRKDLSRRRVIFEHFSRPPSRADLAKCFFETAWAVEQWCRKRQGRPPMGLVLSVGLPRVALDFFPLLRPAEPRGVYRTCAPLADRGLELILVDVKNLAPVSGTAFLRLFDHRADAVKNMDALLEAPEVGRVSRDAIGAAMTKRKDLFEGVITNLTERMDEKFAEGRTEGLAEGTRRTLIRQLERRFGALPREARAKIDAASQKQLEAWTDAFVDARSLKAVLGAGLPSRHTPRRPSSNGRTARSGKVGRPSSKLAR